MVYSTAGTPIMATDHATGHPKIAENTTAGSRDDRAARHRPRDQEQERRERSGLGVEAPFEILVRRATRAVQKERA